MLRYLRIQAHTHSANYAQAMLDHGAYTFAPNVLTDPPLQPIPEQAPVAFRDVLAHAELHEED